MMSRSTLCFALLAYIALILAPGFFTLPPIDRDEARFAQASKQMLETGDPVEIRFQDAARNKKPVGIYWMQAASAGALGGPEAAPIWAYRLPSALGAVLAIVFTWLAGVALVGRQAAQWGTILFAACLLLTVEGHLATTDAMMCAAIAAMQAGLARIFMRTRTQPDAPTPWSDRLLVWGGLGVSALLKGPIGLMVAVLTILGLWLLGHRPGWLRRTYPASGLAIALLIVLPWAVAITIETGGRFWWDAVMGDLLSKAAGGQESHGAPPGYYLLLLMLTLAPASILLIPSAWRAVSARREAWAAFLMAWVVPSWIAFEAIPTKLPHYILPLYPALALAIGAFLASRLAGEPDATPRAARLGNVIAWAPFALILAGLTIAVPVMYGSGPGIADIALALVMVAAAGTLIHAVITAHWRRVVPAALVTAVTFSGILGITLGGAEAFHVSPRLVALAQSAGWTQGRPLASAGYQEPSLVFLTQTGIDLQDRGEEAAAFLASRPDGYVFVEGRQMETFNAAIAQAGTNIQPHGTVEGFNYSRGQKVRIILFRQADAAPLQTN